MVLRACARLPGCAVIRRCGGCSGEVEELSVLRFEYPIATFSPPGLGRLAHTCLFLRDWRNENEVMLKKESGGW